MLEDCHKKMRAGEAEGALKVNAVMESVKVINATLFGADACRLSEAVSQLARPERPPPYTSLQNAAAVLTSY